MLKWILTLMIALAILTALSPWLSRLGLGRLPGDIVVRFRGRDRYLPFTSTILMSLALGLLTQLF